MGFRPLEENASVVLGAAFALLHVSALPDAARICVRGKRPICLLDVSKQI